MPHLIWFPWQPLPSWYSRWKQDHREFQPTGGHTAGAQNRGTAQSSHWPVTAMRAQQLSHRTAALCRPCGRRASHWLSNGCSEQPSEAKTLGRCVVRMRSPGWEGPVHNSGGQATVLSEQARLEVALSDAGVREQGGLPQVLHCRWTQTWAFAEGESFIAWQPIQRWMPTPSAW